MSRLQGCCEAQQRDKTNLCAVENSSWWWYASESHATTRGRPVRQQGSPHSQWSELGGRLWRPLKLDAQWNELGGRLRRQLKLDATESRDDVMFRTEICATRDETFTRQCWGLQKVQFPVGVLGTGKSFLTNPANASLARSFPFGCTHLLSPQESLVRAPTRTLCGRS